MRTTASRPVGRPLAVTAAVALGAVLLLTGGCGSENSAKDGPDPGGSSSTGSSSTGSEQKQAVSVTFTKSGGLKPAGVHLVYSADAPPPDGSTKREVKDVLTAASDPALLDVAMKPVPKNACCDLQSYVVTVTYADGSAKSFRTVDGVQQPAVFEHLLSLLG